MTSSSPRTLLNVLSNLLYALLLRIALLSLSGVRADSIIGNYDSISSGATIVKSDSQCTFSSTLRFVTYNNQLNLGTPQVLYKGEWCTVRSGSIGYYGAKLMCQELGMGDFVGDYYGLEPSYGNQLGGFSCLGYESSLQDCSRQCCWNNDDGNIYREGSRDNPNNDDAGIMCTNDYNPCSGFVITTAAGTGYTGYSSSTSDATSTNLYNPYGVAVDTSDYIYIADTQNSVLRKVNVSSGSISTVAGTGTAGYSSGNIAASSQLNKPKGVAVDSSGDIYIADTSNNLIRVLTLSNETSSCKVALKPYNGILYQGTPMVLHGGVWGTIDNDYWGYSDAQVFCKELGMGDVVTYGSGQYGQSYGTQWVGFSCYGSEISLQNCSQAFGYWAVMDYGSENNPNYDDAGVQCSYASTSNPCLYIDGFISTVVISTFAGGGSSGADGVDATTATLNNPIGLALDSSGNVYVADGGNSRIRKITKSTGIISTYAGGGASFKDGVLATNTALSSTIGICVGSAGYVYIADGGNNRIRKITNGIISTIAGTGTSGYSGDNGPASSATLSNPSGVAVYVSSSKKVTVYIADTGNNCIRQVSMSTITTIAGTGTSGYSGDNGLAASAQLNGPTGIAVNASSGDIYVADNGNNRIRKITYASTYSPSSVTTFAPSTPRIISFPLLMTVDNWPFKPVNEKSETAILTLVTDITDTSKVSLNLTISENNSQRRKLLSSYSLSVVANITTTSSSASAINKKFMDNMSTKKLISALNAACSCTAYNGISISFLSAEDYCIDKNTPTELCSYGHIKINPYLTAIGNYSFEQSYVEGVDFGDCDMLEEIGEYAFADTNMETVDLLACSKLNSVRSGAFASNGITKLMLPKTLKINGTDVFDGNSIAEIWCEAPLDTREMDKVISFSLFRTTRARKAIFVSNCYGYTADYFFYPSLRPNPEVPFIVVLGTAFLGLHMIILFRRNHLLRSYTFSGISLVASADLISSLFDAFFSVFANAELFWASFVFIVLIPSIYFTVAVILYHRLIPHLIYEWFFGRIISLKYKTNILWIWLGTFRGAPLINNKHQSFTFNNHDSLPKLFIYVFSWVMLVALQLMSLIPFALWLAVLCPYYMFVICSGAFLYHTKLLAHRDIWNTWVYLFTGRVNRYGKKSVFDTKLLNDAFFLQLLLTSLPILLVKITNYLQNDARGLYTSNAFRVFYPDFIWNKDIFGAWPPISLALTALYCVVGIYRYVYLPLRYDFLLQEVPFFCLTWTIERVVMPQEEENREYNKVSIIPSLKCLLNMLLQQKVDDPGDRGYEMKARTNEAEVDQAVSGVYAIQVPDVEGASESAVVGDGGDTVQLFETGAKEGVADYNTTTEGANKAAAKSGGTTRKIFNSSTKIYNTYDTVDKTDATVVENNPNIRKVVNRSGNAPQDSQSGYNTVSNVPTDEGADEQASDSASWNAPATAKKSWFSK